MTDCVAQLLVQTVAALFIKLLQNIFREDPMSMVFIAVFPDLGF
jgi:hypothetical protein